MPELSSTERFAVLRILDANFNRATEALRVIEEFSRFHSNSQFMSGELKSLRHQLTSAISKIEFKTLLAARDTQHDVGTTISLPSEQERGDLPSLLRANFQRLTQALRALEEYGKLVSTPLAMEVEQLRYRTYVLEKAVLQTAVEPTQFVSARLYVLIDGRASEAEFRTLTTSLIEAGVDLLQLRDKSLDDRTLLARARVLRELTRSSPTRFIMNDRPDLATLAEADGVHVGQEELSVADVRKIVHEDMIIGVSTHTIEQARQAELDGADYIGCGPTFPSATKSFDQFTGLVFLKAVAQEIALPAFAIGGITVENLPQVLATGIQRVAVSGAVTQAADPAAEVRALRTLLAS